MSETGALFLLLCLLYLSECVCWVPRNSVAFLTRDGRRWRIVGPSALCGNARGGLVLANPMPPLGPVYVCHLPPVSLSPRHAASFTSHTLSPTGRPPQSGRVCAYADVASVAVSGRGVRVNGEAFVRCAGAQQASLVAGCLTRLLPLTEAGRALEITKALGEAFDVDGARRRISEYTQRARALRLTCHLTFATLFVVAPGVVWHFGVTRSLLPLAAAMWALAAAIVAMFWRTHKVLYPRGTEERVSAALKMVLCPPIAVRANDLLTSELLAAYHPLAVAFVLCDREAFARFARQVAVDIRHPLRAELNDPDGIAADAWHRKAVEGVVGDFLRQRGVDLRELLGTPARSDPASGSYCPRCSVEYAVRTGECADCSGVSLSPFADGGSDGAATK